MKMENTRQICLFALSLIICFFFIGATPAQAVERFLPGHNILITALYGEGAAPGLGSRMTWTLQCRVDKTAVTWAYRKEDGDLFCTLSTGTDQPFKFKLVDKRGRLLESTLNGFIPVAGFPAPCQIFGLDTLEEDGSFDIVRLAGGRRFISSLAYTCETVKPETALENNWLLSGSSAYDSKKALVMVTVVDASNVTLIRQLWQDGDAWWLYEETAFAQFWRQSGDVK